MTLRGVEAGLGRAEPSYEQLRALVAFAECGTVTAAAELLGVSQPALSQRLRGLEERLGVALVEPVGRTLRLTEPGRAILAAARQALDALQRLEDVAVSRRTLTGGVLHVAASNTTGLYRLPGWLAGFVDGHPQIRAIVRLTNTTEAVADLEDYRADLALVEGPCHTAHVEQLVLEHDRLSVVAAAGHPLAAFPVVPLERLATERYLARESGSGTEALAAELLGPAYRCGSVLELGQVDAVKAGLLAGLGYAVISLAAVEPELADGRLRRLRVEGRPAMLARDLRALRREGDRTPATAAFWEHLRRTATPAESPSGEPGSGEPASEEVASS